MNFNFFELQFFILKNVGVGYMKTKRKKKEVTAFVYKSEKDDLCLPQARPHRK